MQKVSATSYRLSLNLAIVWGVALFFCTIIIALGLSGWSSQVPDAKASAKADASYNQDCISGTEQGAPSWDDTTDPPTPTYPNAPEPGAQVGKSAGNPNAPNIPCDVQINALVSENVSLDVELGPETKDPANPGSADIDNRLVLFAPYGDDEAHVFGDHELTLHVSDGITAKLALSVHTSTWHGIAPDPAYEGKMVCLYFCSANTDVRDDTTYIARNSEECAYNGDISDPTNNPTPCVLDPNSWGFRLDDEQDIDYKPVPHENANPYLLPGMDINGATKRVLYAVSTNKHLRPGFYGVTTVYTLTAGA